VVLGTVIIYNVASNWWAAIPALATGGISCPVISPSVGEYSTLAGPCGVGDQATPKAAGFGRAFGLR